MPASKSIQSMPRLPALASDSALLHEQPYFARLFVFPVFYVLSPQ